MRHNVHILLGQDLKTYVSRVAKHVIKYGEGGASDFYRCLSWEKRDDGSIDVKKAVIDANAGAGFVSTTSDMYSTRLEQDSLLAAVNPEMQLQHFFSGMHQNIVTINNRGDSNSLLLVLYLPLYDADLCQQVIDVVSAVDRIPSQFSVMVVGFCSDLHYLINSSAHRDITPEEEKRLFEVERQSVHRLCELQLGQNSMEQFVVLQNINAEGFALNLDDDSFVRIIGELSLLCVEKYNTIFSQTVAFDREHPISSLGLSVLNLDKYYFANYLLRRSYLHILEREDVSAEAVDVNKVAIIADEHLKAHLQLFSKFYEKEITPQVRIGTPQTTIMADAAQKLDDEKKAVSEHLLDFISDPALTLPEKKALLAMILGYDDPLLRGNLFNQDQLTLDNLDEDAANVFIKANNSLVRSEVVNDRVVITGGVLQQCVGEDGRVELPIRKLQQLRNRMRESTNYIRQKNQELEEIEQMTEDSEESEHLLTEDGFVVEGKVYRFDVEHEEVKFDETYAAKPVTDKNVDLRSNFTPVKNQGQIGACTVFSIASIFEYILKKNSHTVSDLSEAFVYYNVRHEEGKENEDTGSSFQDVIRSMGTTGICSEEMHPYTEDLAAVPSAEAYADAKTRTIVKAMNVNVKEEDIKSAIQDGYPVAVSLKVFESFKSFNDNGGFIPYPCKEEIDSGDFGYHAVVVCGYDDDAKFFVVRNSWGEGYGDKGYCYVPYSYICDNDLNRMACIVTEVDTTGSDVKTVVVGRGDKGLIVQFNMNDAKIKSRIIQNLLDEEKRNLARMQKEDQALRSAYETLMQNLGRQSVRSQILQSRQNDLKSQIERARARQQEINSKEREEALSTFDKGTVKMRIGLIIASLLTFIGWCIGCYCYMKDSDADTAAGDLMDWLQSGWCIFLSLLLLVLIVITGLYWWYIHDQRRRLEMELEDQSARQAQIAAKCKRELEEVQLRFHVAGMVIEGMLSLRTALDKKYQSMKSYIGNLAVWQKEEQAAVDTMEPLVKDPFIPLLNNRTLEQYFNSHRDEITHEMHLYEYFNSYQLNDDAIVRYKLEMKDKLKAGIQKLLGDFSIFRHIFGVKQYPYLDNEYASAENLLPVLDGKSVPFGQIVFSPLVMPQARFLFIHTDHEEEQAWKSTYPRYFATTPISEDMVSVYKIVELRLQPLAESELMMRV